eukprot:COSAG02_NODE_7104_length_3184_cov_6.937115_2_plen_964_part_01
MCRVSVDMVDALLAEDMYDKAQPLANAFGVMLDEPILELESRLESLEQDKAQADSHVDVLTKQVDELQKTRDRDRQDHLSAQESLKQQLEKYTQEQVDAALTQAQQEASEVERLLEPQMRALSKQVEELQEAVREQAAETAARDKAMEERHQGHLEAAEAGVTQLDQLKAAVAQVEAGAAKQWSDAQAELRAELAALKEEAEEAKHAREALGGRIAEQRDEAAAQFVTITTDVQNRVAQVQSELAGTASALDQKTDKIERRAEDAERAQRVRALQSVLKTYLRVTQNNASDLAFSAWVDFVGLMRCVDALRGRTSASLRRHTWQAWRVWAWSCRRSRVLGMRAVLVMEQGVVRGSFLPWLIAARKKVQRRNFVSAAEMFDSHRQLKIERAIARATTKVTLELIQAAFEGWINCTRRKLRIEVLTEKHMINLELGSLGALYRVWLSAARAKQASGHQGADARTKERLEVLCERLAERQHTDAVMLGGLAEEFEQLRFDQTEETQQRHTQVALINEALQAFAGQVDDQNAQQRHRKIQKRIARSSTRVRVGLALDYFSAWLDRTRKKKRLQKLKLETVHVLEDAHLAHAFTPWLVAARQKIQSNITTKTDAIESMEYRVLRLDGTLTSHEKQSAELLVSIVEQLGKLQDDVDTTVKPQQDDLASQLESRFDYLESKIEHDVEDLEVVALKRTMKSADVAKKLDRDIRPTVQVMKALMDGGSMIDSMDDLAGLSEREMQERASVTAQLGSESGKTIGKAVASWSRSMSKTEAFSRWKRATVAGTLGMSTESVDVRPDPGLQNGIWGALFEELRTKAATREQAAEEKMENRAKVAGIQEELLAKAAKRQQAAEAKKANRAKAAAFQAELLADAADGQQAEEDIQAVARNSHATNAEQAERFDSTATVKPEPEAEYDLTAAEAAAAEETAKRNEKIAALEAARVAQQEALEAQRATNAEHERMATEVAA